MTFDEFVEKWDIQSEEIGAAFGAWLNGETGWDGKMEEVHRGDEV